MAIELPSNVEAERVVLGSVLISPEAGTTAISSLSEEDFSDADPRNRIIFHAMKELSAHNQPIDASTVLDQLLNTHLAEAAGGSAYLYELVVLPLNPDNIDHYIQMVSEQSVLRELLLKTADIQKQYAKGVSDIGSFITRSNDEISRIAQKRSVQGMRKAAEVAALVQEKINKKSQNDTRGLTGIHSGFKSLDDITHGWQKGDLIILAARPSVGKTALGMNFAMNAALKDQITVAFFSLEMGAEQVVERLVASRSSVSSDRIQTGYISKSDRLKIASAIDEISHTKILFDDTPNSKLGDLVAKATKAKRTNPDLGLIVIDYLGRIQYSDKVNTNAYQQEVGLISGSLKTLARSLNVPVICLAQLNRNVEDNEGKRPSLANLRDSGSIEQDADIVMMLYRPDYYTAQGFSLTKKYNRGKPGEEDQPPAPAPTREEREKTGDMSEVELLIAKNRNGKIGDVKLLFQKSYSRFIEPTDDYMQKQADLANGGFDMQ